jgi:hypothetical protein
MSSGIRIPCAHVRDRINCLALRSINTINTYTTTPGSIDMQRTNDEALSNSLLFAYYLYVFTVENTTCMKSCMVIADPVCGAYSQSSFAP